MQAATLTLLLSAAALRLHCVGIWSWAAPGIVVGRAVAYLMAFTLASFTPSFHILIIHWHAAATWRLADRAIIKLRL